MGEKAIGLAARKLGRLGKPEPMKRPPKAIERSFRRPQAPVRPLAPTVQQPGTGQPKRGKKHQQEKAIGQGDQQGILRRGSHSRSRRDSSTSSAF